MNVLREQREYAVFEAAQRERDAWTALERASRQDVDDETLVQACRERWQVAARSLIRALQRLKG